MTDLEKATCVLKKTESEEAQALRTIIDRFYDKLFCIVSTPE